ncbi:hypothetical protein Bphyt_3726 [Paraburkholderia phytofirmans PsJN]|uniref:Uncharacterized protein n=1 Tax=Paraburkholderia phytofirmans (strain DSM 17436 / LMG 22146 / PsJN) TaxID=398527 RepID=B2T6U2_PARPJ|nr:hypothetical protein Bphyt_3726 [Paraburkholderia phytofirmans PsJN]
MERNGPRNGSDEPGCATAPMTIGEAAAALNVSTEFVLKFSAAGELGPSPKARMSLRSCLASPFCSFATSGRSRDWLRSRT